MKSLQTTFESLTREEPRQALRLRILAQIQMLEERRMHREKWFSLSILSLSVFVFFGGMYQYGPMLLQSDFWMLLSLVFSDLGILMGSFQYFIYSLLETLRYSHGLLSILHLFASRNTSKDPRPQPTPIPMRIIREKKCIDHS